MKPQYNPKLNPLKNFKNAYEKGRQAQKQDELTIWQNGFKEGKKLEQKETAEKVEKLKEAFKFSPKVWEVIDKIFLGEANDE